MGARVSVVVPFFNLQHEAQKCVESLLAQTYCDYELLLIDDGSTDATPTILDKYRVHDAVKVFHVANGGLSRARNYGVKRATGDYITFVDGDDYVSPHYLEALVGGLVPGCKTLVVAGSIVVSTSQKVAWERPSPKNCRMLSPCEATVELAYDRIKSAAWAKLAPRELYEEVPFPPGRLYEEVSTAAEHLLRVQKVIVVDIPAYAYVMHPGSIVNRKKVRYRQVDDYDEAIRLACQAIKKSGCPDVCAALGYQKSLQLMRLMLLLHKAEDEPDRVEARKRLLRRELRQLLPGVLHDSRAGIAAKVRLALAAYTPSVYLGLIRLRDALRAGHRL